MKHLTPTQIQEYVDNISDENEFHEIELHLNICRECTEKLNAYKELDSVLRKVQLEKVSVDFTQGIIRHLGLHEQPSFSWAFFKNLAPLIGLTIIISTLYFTSKYFGLYESSDIKQSVHPSQMIYNTVKIGLSDGLAAFTNWLQNIFPFLYSKSSYSLTVFLLLLFGIVALLDRFIFMPIVKKKV